MTKPWSIRRDDLMTLEEWGRLRRHLRERAELAERRRTRTSIVNEAVIMTAVGTGLRRSELAALTVGDLRLKNELPYLIVRRGKGGKRREVPMSSGLRVFLKRFLRWKERQREPLFPESRLFMSQRGGYTGGGINRLFKKACIEAGIRPLHAHSCRHFVGTQLYSQTKDLRLVQKVLGHARLNTTQVYIEVQDEDIRAGMAAYNKILSGLIPTPKRPEFRVIGRAAERA